MRSAIVAALWAHYLDRAASVSKGRRGDEHALRGASSRHVPRLRRSGQPAAARERAFGVAFAHGEMPSHASWQDDAMGLEHDGDLDFA